MEDEGRTESEINQKALIFLFVFAGSVTFLVLPYLVNLIMAVTIKQQKIVRTNKFASQYFSNNPAVFLFLTLISGGAYASLTMVSSRYVF